MRVTNAKELWKKLEDKYMTKSVECGESSLLEEEALPFPISCAYFYV